MKYEFCKLGLDHFWSLLTAPAQKQPDFYFRFKVGHQLGVHRAGFATRWGIFATEI